MAWTPFGIQDRSNATPVSAAYMETFGEHIYDLAIADAVGGGTTPQAGIFLPETYGAVGDDAGAAAANVVAIQACWDALKASGSGTMLLGPYTYHVNAAPRTDQGGHSIIALGSSGTTNRTYRVQGFPGRSRIQNSRADGAYSANFGPPSVVGGPTFEQIGGSLNQIAQFIEWSGVDVYTAVGGGLTGPSYSGLDLGKYVKAHVSNSKFSSTAPAQLPERRYTFGLRLPIGLTHGKNHAEYINSTGWFCGIVFHTAHLVLLNTIPKWCVMGYGIDGREGADNHSAYAGYMESEWCNYHLGGWHPTLGVEDLANTRQFYITGSWDTEDMDPEANGGVTLTGNTTIGSPTISGVASTAAVTVGDYIVSSLFARATTVTGKAATTITASSNAFGTQVQDTFQIGGEEGTAPIWWYTLFHVFDLNNRIFGHLDWQNVRGNVGITEIQPIKRGGDNLSVSRIANLQGSIPPAARVYSSAAIPVASGTAPVLDFDSERFDTRGLHHPTINPSRLTVPVEGIYQVTAHIQWEANATGHRQVLLTANGGVAFASEMRPAVTTGNPTRMSIASVQKFAAGNYVEVEVNQNSGAPLDVEVSGASSAEFAMAYLGNVT